MVCICLAAGLGLSGVHVGRVFGMMLCCRSVDFFFGGFRRIGAAVRRKDG